MRITETTALALAAAQSLEPRERVGVELVAQVAARAIDVLGPRELAAPLVRPRITP